MKKLFITLIVLTILSSGGYYWWDKEGQPLFWEKTNENGIVLSGNPASDYCIQQGGKLSMKKNDSSEEIGWCTLPEGNKCEEWDFFRGECPITIIEESEPLGSTCGAVSPDSRNECCREKMKDTPTFAPCEWKYDENLGDCQCQGEEPLMGGSLPTQEEATIKVEDFIKTAGTYAYDGSDLKQESVTPQRCPGCFEFVYSFTSSHGGYGDRSEQMTTQVITEHTVEIKVDSGEINYVVIDEKWDEMKQEEVEE